MDEMKRIRIASDVDARVNELIAKTKQSKTATIDELLRESLDRREKHEEAHRASGEQFDELQESIDRLSDYTFGLSAMLAWGLNDIYACVGVQNAKAGRTQSGLRAFDQIGRKAIFDYLPILGKHIRDGFTYPQALYDMPDFLGRPVDALYPGCTKAEWEGYKRKEQDHD